MDYKTCIFERIIWDLVEDAEEDELILDELAEHQYVVEEDGRRGPRQLLLLSPILSMDLENDSDGKEIVEMAANVLRLSKRALLLENDYGNHLCNLARQINKLDVWYRILKRAGYPTAEADATLEGLA